MMRSKSAAVLIALAILVSAGAASADTFYQSLNEGAEVNGFTATALYLNGQDVPMGARFVSDKYGFVVDLLQIQSVPQGFFWVNTPPESDKGEPHTCEHLLLGKGNLGRYVSGLEDMSLGSSSAYTSQTYTCYHFNTKGGEDIFYKLFEAKLNALCNPDFTDEEIRREVCHIGVTVSPEDSTLHLEEKGTVYTEMVSSFEKHWYYLWGRIGEMLYGSNHPLANNSGGKPDAIRTMTAEDLRKFHDSAYHLGNMGVIVSIPDNIKPEEFLAKTAAILGRIQDFEESPEKVGMTAYDVPPPAPEAEPGTIEITGFPSENPQDPGHILFAYPADLDLTADQEFMLDLFTNTFGSGQTSNLYNLFINSETRVLDIGGTNAFAYYSEDIGFPIYFGMSGVNAEDVSEDNVAKVRGIILDELNKIAQYKAGSDELAEFNKRALAQLTSRRKRLEEMFNQPPMFGFRRGTAGQWHNVLASLERFDGFRKSLVFKDDFDKAEQLLSSDDNIWTDYIKAWHIADAQPLAVAVKPDATIIRAEQQAKQERLASYVEQFKQRYDEEDAQAAIRDYQEDFDAATQKLEAMYSKGDMPAFMDNPPMSMDPNLKYEVVTVADQIPTVASTFDNMTSATLGIAMGLNVVPEDQLLYLPFLSAVMTDIGVIKDGDTITYDEMDNRMRNEILGYNAYFDYNAETDRAEMVLRGQGANQAELETALGWMEASLFSPYLAEENLSRMMDVVDQSLVGARNRMKGSEEAWVNEPATGWQYQHNPLMLTVDNFLTQAHHLHRVKFRLMDPGTPDDMEMITEFVTFLRPLAEGRTGDELMAVLSAIDDTTQELSGPAAELKDQLDKLETSETAHKNALAMVRALKQTLPEIPDGALMTDWDYLCREMQVDLSTPPGQVLKDMKNVLAMLRHKDNTRMFMISSGADREASMQQIDGLMAKFDDTPSEPAAYAMAPRILSRLQDHAPDAQQPVYVGLVNENTRNGVIIMSARNAGQYDTTESSVLDCLAAKLYGGGGGHGLFMKTWGAGLAYSNGIGYGQRSGKVRYYAERCPDVSETMRFVVNTLESAEKDPFLKEYAIAQVFGSSRAADQYERRGEEMASDLADGYEPEVVSRFRERILSLRDRDDLYETIDKRKENVYGKVLIGYGETLADAGGDYFLIGPEPQFESWEQLIKQEESPQTVYRLYPRDYWLTM